MRRSAGSLAMEHATEPVNADSGPSRFCPSVETTQAADQARATHIGATVQRRVFFAERCGGRGVPPGSGHDPAFRCLVSLARFSFARAPAPLLRPLRARATAGRFALPGSFVPALRCVTPARNLPTACDSRVGLPARRSAGRSSRRATRAAGAAADRDATCAAAGRHCGGDGRRMNGTLEAMARALFRDWFVDFGPVRAKAGGREPYLPGDIWNLLPDALEDDGKPFGWTTYTIAALACHHRATLSPIAAPERIYEHCSSPACDAGNQPLLNAGDSIKRNKTIAPDGAVLLFKINPDIGRVWLPGPVDEAPQVAATEFLALTPLAGNSGPSFPLVQEQAFQDGDGCHGHRRLEEPPARLASGAVRLRCACRRSNAAGHIRSSGSPLDGSTAAESPGSGDTCPRTKPAGAQAHLRRNPRSPGRENGRGGGMSGAPSNAALSARVGRTERTKE